MANILGCVSAVGNLELEHLLVLAPVDHKAKLHKVKPGKLRNVQHNLRVLPLGALPSNSSNRSVLYHRRRHQLRPSYLLTERIYPMRPRVAGVANHH